PSPWTNESARAHLPPSETGGTGETRALLREVLLPPGERNLVGGRGVVGRVRGQAVLPHEVVGDLVSRGDGQICVADGDGVDVIRPVALARRAEPGGEADRSQRLHGLPALRGGQVGDADVDRAAAVVRSGGLTDAAGIVRPLGDDDVEAEEIL